MPTRIQITKEGEPESGNDRLFDLEVITIGRDDDNAVHLESPIISKKHAEIICKGSTLYITDLESRNGTFLNNEKIPPGKPHPLRPEDTVGVGEFLLHVRQEERQRSKESKRADRSGARDVSSPGPVLNVQVLEQYRRPDLVEQRASLRQQAMDMLRELEQTDHSVLLAQLQALQEECTALREENEALKKHEGTVARDVKLPEPARARQIVINDATGAGGRADLVVNTLLQTVARLMQGRASFVTEFFSRTMASNPEWDLLHSGSMDRLKSFLLDPALQEKEFQRRLLLFREGCDELLTHVQGLIAGYWGSVKDGSKRLLKKLDPAELWRESQRDPVRIGPLQLPVHFLPLVAHFRLRGIFGKRYAELMEEAGSTIEKRFFKPGFSAEYEQPEKRRGRKETT